MEGNKTSIVILSIVLFVLFAGLLGSLIYYNPKVNSLTTHIGSLQTEIGELNDRIIELNKSIIELTNDKTQIQESLNLKTEEYDYLKNTLKEYFTLTKVISEDLEAISLTLENYPTSIYSSGYDRVKISVDRYKTQLNTYKTHISKLKTVIEENKEIFEEINLDATIELERINNLTPVLEDILDNMNADLEDIKN